MSEDLMEDLDAHMSVLGNIYGFDDETLGMIGAVGGHGGGHYHDPYRSRGRRGGRGPHQDRGRGGRGGGRGNGGGRGGRGHQGPGAGRGMDPSWADMPNSNDNHRGGGGRNTHAAPPQQPKVQEPAGGPPPLHPQQRGEYTMTRGADVLKFAPAVTWAPQDLTVRVLNVDATRAEQFGDAELAAAARAYPSLAHVSLVNTRVTSQGLLSLATACPFIEVLDLKSCRNCDVNTFHELVRLLPRLKYIDIRGSGAERYGQFGHSANLNLLVDV